VSYRHWSFLQSRGVLAAILVSMIGAGFSGHAGYVSMKQAARPAPPERLPSGYEADDHFPGAALLLSIEDGDAIAPGVTGTIALPDLPVPADDAAALAVSNGTVRPAPPFILTGTESDRARALQCLTTAIYYEAANEPADGQAAVAQVILNRVRHPAFPNTVCGVVYQGSERAGCQFSFACDGALARRPVASAWDRARRAAQRALDGQVMAGVGYATHYHTYAVKPYWASSLVMTGVFGAHFFHRWKGYWGTPGAFRSSYAGGEPVPGPHRAVAMTVMADLSVTPVALTVPSAAVALPPPASPAPDLQGIQPRWTESGTAIKVPEAAANPALAPTPGDDQILPRWRDSGKPIR
jgi:spore germination cell wall hydrolase CwlJ-like protein